MYTKKKMWTLENVKGESFSHVFIYNKIVITIKFTSYHM